MEKRTQQKKTSMEEDFNGRELYLRHPYQMMTSLENDINARQTQRKPPSIEFSFGERQL